MKILKKIFSISWIINIFIPTFIINRKLKVHYSKDKYFTIRNLGGSSYHRARNFFDYESDTVEWINNFKDSSKFLDVGANICCYSLYAAKTKNCEVLALEPESSNYFSASKNIIDNKLDKKITLLPLCAGKMFEVGDLNLRSFKMAGSGHSFNSNLDQQSKKFNPISIQKSLSINLDNLFKLTKFFPNYIKVDVDGNEKYVLEGMSSYLKDENLKSILIEVDKENINYNEIVQKILSNGFKIIEYKKTINNSNIIFERN